MQRLSNYSKHDEQFLEPGMNTCSLGPHIMLMYEWDVEGITWSMGHVVPPRPHCVPTREPALNIKLFREPIEHDFTFAFLIAKR